MNLILEYNLIALNGGYHVIDDLLEVRKSDTHYKRIWVNQTLEDNCLLLDKISLCRKVYEDSHGAISDDDFLKHVFFQFKDFVLELHQKFPIKLQKINVQLQALSMIKTNRVSYLTTYFQSAKFDLVQFEFRLFLMSSARTFFHVKSNFPPHARLEEPLLENPLIEFWIKHTTLIFLNQLFVDTLLLPHLSALSDLDYFDNLDIKT